MTWSRFDRGADGKVRVGVWDLVCVPGHDEKDGQSTDFDEATLSQMADNFAERADPIPIDFNHQSNHAAQNGQPAPALGFYGALAVVSGGQIVKLGVARDTPPMPGSTAVSPSTASQSPPDLSRDGLWCFRSEVTELGERLLPNFKLVSPTFMKNGVRRDGSECGYCLAAVAATNTPWQSGTEITFEKGAASAKQGAKEMAKLSKLAAFAGLKEDADDGAIKQGILGRMSKMAAEAVMDDDGGSFAYDDSASQLESAAKEFEDAHFEDDGEDPTAGLRKMAAKFRRMGKMAGGNSAGPRAGLTPGDQAAAPPSASPEPSPSEASRTGDSNKMAVMQASIAAMSGQLAELKAEKAAREAAALKERDQRFERLADQAVAGGYPKESRGALIAFARTDEAGARTLAAPFLPKTGAPSHLFDRVSAQGGPIGGPTSAREDGGPVKKRVIKNGFGRFIEDDGALADEVRKTAESKDPALMAKVNKLIPSAARQEVMFERLQAANRIVRAERPDLAAAADDE